MLNLLSLSWWAFMFGFYNPLANEDVCRKF